MRILKLTDLKILPMEAYLYSRVKDGVTKKYYNIKHGSEEKGFKVYKCLLDKVYFNPELLNDNPLILKDDNYCLKQFISKDKNNKQFVISVSNVETYKRDILVFWEIPNFNFTDVEYTLTGNVSEVDHGIIGKYRPNAIYKSPAPVLEIYGSCKLSWKAISDTNIEYSQTIEYDITKDSWVINSIQTKDLKG